MESFSDRRSALGFAPRSALGFALVPPEPVLGLDRSAPLGAAAPPAPPLPVPLLLDPWPTAKVAPPIKPAMVAATNKLRFLMGLSLLKVRCVMSERFPKWKAVRRRKAATQIPMHWTGIRSRGLRTLVTKRTLSIWVPIKMARAKPSEKGIAAPSGLTRRREKNGWPDARQFANGTKFDVPNGEKPEGSLLRYPDNYLTYNALFLMRCFWRFVSAAAARNASPARLSGSAYFVNRSHCARTESRAPRVLALTTSQLTKG